MRRLFFFILLAAAVAGGYKYRAEFVKLFEKATQYPPAETPDKAAELFAKYIKERDYNGAAHYCTQPYGDLLRSAADQANNVGSRLDELTEKVKKVKEADTPEVRLVIALMDPYPKDGLVIKVDKTSDGEKGAATFAMLPPAMEAAKEQTAMPQGYKVDPQLPMALWRELPARVNMVKTKEGEKVTWKLDFPTPVGVQNGAAMLNKKGKDLASEMRDLSMALNNDADVKANFAKHLRDSLEKSTLR